MDPFALVRDEGDIYQGIGQVKSPAALSLTSKYSNNVIRWIKCEYFYSWIDRPYFLNNDFKALLSKLDLSQARLTTYEWSLVRQALRGDRERPRRFSDKFIEEEKAKLCNYRDIFREIIK